MGATSQSFDSDMIPKLQQARDVLEECGKKLAPAMEQSVELAQKNGLGKLLTSATNSVEGAQVFAKSITEAVESVDNLIAYIKKIDGALG